MAKKVNVTPLHDRVIVKAAAAEEKTAGGIIIPDTAKEKPQKGTVVAVGPSRVWLGRICRPARVRGLVHLRAHGRRACRASLRGGACHALPSRSRGISISTSPDGVLNLFFE